MQKYPDDLRAVARLKAEADREMFRNPTISNDLVSRNGSFFRSNLFIFLMGEVITVLIGIIFFAVGFGRVSQQFSEAMEWRAVTQARLERMDKEGTNASRYGLSFEKSAMDDYDKRLRFVEEQGRKIDVMVEKINRLEEGVKEAKGIKR